MWRFRAGAEHLFALFCLLAISVVWLVFIVLAIRAHVYGLALAMVVAGMIVLGAGLLLMPRKPSR